MASKRGASTGRLRRNCEKKRRYGSREEAAVRAPIAMAGRRRRLTDGAHKIVAYRCCYCHGWHIGHAVGSGKTRVLETGGS